MLLVVVDEKNLDHERIIAAKAGRQRTVSGSVTNGYKLRRF